MCTICNITYGKEVECENIDPRALISTLALRASVDIQPDDMIMIPLFGLLWHITYVLALSFTTGLHNHHKILLLQYYIWQFSPFHFRSLLSAWQSQLVAHPRSSARNQRLFLVWDLQEDTHATIAMYIHVTCTNIAILHTLWCNVDISMFTLCNMK